MTDTSASAPSGSGPAPLRTERVIKRYGDNDALAGVSLELTTNEILALVGPSGCGKTTLLRVIAGLVNADDGRVLLRGDVVDDGETHLPSERRRVGLVFQEHALFPHLTVAENVGFGVRPASGGRREARPRSRRSSAKDRVAEMLELVSLGGFGDRYPHELSGGERQRVALARALAPEPALMLFDEPFASLDHNLRMQLRADVVGALKATHTPAVFVTHDQSEALAIGDRIAVMRRGRIEQLATPAVVFHQPANRFVASFMGEATFLSIEPKEDHCATRLGPIEMDPDRTNETSAMVRPDDVAFVPDPVGASVVVGAEYRGTGWLLTVRLDDGTQVLSGASHLLTPVAGMTGHLSLVAGHRQVIVENDSASMPSV